MQNFRFDLSRSSKREVKPPSCVFLRLQPSGKAECILPGERLSTFDMPVQTCHVNFSVLVVGRRLERFVYKPLSVTPKDIVLSHSIVSKLIYSP